MLVQVRRQWNDHRTGTVSIDKLEGLRWDSVSGGVQALTPRPFIHGYILCTDIDGDVAHSHLHGPGPHRIKVCIVKKDNNNATWNQLIEIVGPKPNGRVRE